MLSHRSSLLPALVMVAAALPAQDPLYYTTAEIEQEIDNVASAFPALAMKVELSAWPGAARTHNQNAIYALKVSDNVAVDEDEPALLLAGQHHARELMTPHIVIRTMQRLTQGYATDPALQAVVDGHEIYLVPCVNPDGVDWVWSTDPTWRKNRRPNGTDFGVDLNRNYPTLWGASCGGSTTTSSNTYRGPLPASEPETQTMRAVVQALRPEVYLDFHSFGQEVLHTYAPCASVTPQMRSFINTYMFDLAVPMSYSFRLPGASGEAPEDHWNESGTLSFLIETGQTFQPSFTTAVTEEARVWPGVRQALTVWAPALRGHVRSVYRRQPIEAAITFTPNLFTQGERTMSRARDGRYGLWLPVGTWVVKWSAPGFTDVTRTVTVVSLNQPQTLDVRMVPSWQPATLQVSGSHRIGTTTSLTYASPGDAGLVYLVPLSLGTSPGIPVGTRTIPLNGDPLFLASFNIPSILSNNVGVLPASGQATASFMIPSLQGLVGLTFYTAGITVERGYPSSAKKWSAAHALVFQP